MEKIISLDGVPISYQKTGSGQALILVHGANGDLSRWSLMEPILSPHFTVYVMDRRGRGQSGDSPNYSVKREYEDVACLANSIGSPVDLLGHSFGAACILGAAHSIPLLHRLILYEPPVLKTVQSPLRDDLLDKMDQALKAGNPEEVIVLMLRDMLKVDPEIIEKMKAFPAWAKQTQTAHTIPRELRFSDDYASDLDLLKTITAPVLLLIGSNSHDSFKMTVETLHNILPENRVVVLAGQQHSAMQTAPELFAREVIDFLQ